MVKVLNVSVELKIANQSKNKEKKADFELCKAQQYFSCGLAGLKWIANNGYKRVKLQQSNKG